jgi:hypothetical protein
VFSRIRIPNRKLHVASSQVEVPEEGERRIEGDEYGK